MQKSAFEIEHRGTEAQRNIFLKRRLAQIHADSFPRHAGFDGIKKAAPCGTAFYYRVISEDYSPTLTCTVIGLVFV